MISGDEPKGIIGRVYVDGFPVIYKFVNEMPPEAVRARLKWLTVISWKYDRSVNNGMPTEEDNKRMITLEDTIEKHIQKDGVLRHVYSRTGNGQKEFAYYIRNQDEFLSAFNSAVSGHSRYPIEIEFFEDAEWSDFQRVLDDFSGAANKPLNTDAEDGAG